MQFTSQPPALHSAALRAVSGWLALIGGLALSSPWGRAENAPEAAMVLLKNRCFSCHNEQKAKGGLVMNSREALLKGGDNGAALTPGEPDKSPVITSLAADADPHMPPKKQLSPEQIATLTAWVKNGAEWDASALKGKPREVTLAPLPASYHPVLAVALSPDGARLAASCGNDLVLYQVGEKELTFLARASAHPDPIQSIAWSKDGARLATGAFRRVVLWNARELSAERVIRDGLTDRVTSIRFTPDRLLIADGRIAEEGVLRVADPATGAITAAWTAHADLIQDLAVSPDGKLVATAGADRLVKLWDLAAQKETGRIEGHSSQVLTVAFNADGTQLVTGGADQQLKAWDVKTRDQAMLLGQHKSAVNAAAWVATGPSVFAITDAGSLLRYKDFKPHTGAQSSDSATERRYEAAPITLYSLAVSANAERVFAGAHDGRILGWNKDGKLTIQVSAQAPASAPATAAISP